MKHLLTFALSLSFLACGNAQQPPPRPSPSIKQGVYGFTSYFDDVCTSVCEVRHTSMSIVAMRDKRDDVAYTATSAKETGFYEIAMAAGTYQLCTTFRRCTTITIEQDKLVEANYEMGAGPGWSL